MSTGRIIPEGKFSLSDFDIFVLQLGYAPAKFLQLNFSVVPFFGNPYWSVGGKVQIVPPSGLLQGISIGCDAGYFHHISDLSSDYNSKNLVSLNMAGSFGNEYLRGHISLMQLNFSSESGNLGMPTWLFLGTDYIIYRFMSGSGIKLILETYYARANSKLEQYVYLLGVRFFSNTTALDIAAPFSRYYFLSDDRNQKYYLWIPPYFSLSILF
jgi:hypothetical protein